MLAAVTRREYIYERVEGAEPRMDNQRHTGKTLAGTALHELIVGRSAA